MQTLDQLHSLKYVLLFDAVKTEKYYKKTIKKLGENREVWAQSLVPSFAQQMGSPTSSRILVLDPLRRDKGHGSCGQVKVRILRGGDTSKATRPP